MDETAIKINNIRKTYGLFNKVEALKGVSIDVPRYSAFALLGANGAGKTTLLKLILGLMRPTNGTISVFNGNVRLSSSRATFGYLPENHVFPNYLTGKDALRFYGGLSFLSGSKLKTLVPHWLERVGLTEKQGQMSVRKYSKGMLQRLGIAQALIHRPNVVFLDEPTDGVDPKGRVEIRELLEEERERGMTIFLNSHLLTEVEKVCDRVVILDKGLIRWEGTLEDINSDTHLFGFRISLSPDSSLDRISLTYPSFVRTDDGFELKVNDEEEITKIVDLLRDEEITIYEIKRLRKSLEDFYIQVLNGEEGGK